MNLLVIDPGTNESAILSWNGDKVADHSVDRNDLILDKLAKGNTQVRQTLAVEMVASYGMSVGKEVFETVLWIGRFIQQWKVATGDDARLVYRRDIKLHLCGSMRAKDANIRQALIDRIGPQGKKANPGPTYGLAKHDWAALAIAVYVADTVGAAH